MTKEEITKISQLGWTFLKKFEGGQIVWIFSSLENLRFLQYHFLMPASLGGQ